MRRIESEEIERLPGQRIQIDAPFTFGCHPRIGCFNLCCRNLNLFLYPYDVIRLKNHLNISSDIFIEEYVDVIMREGNYFPDVLLRMKDDDVKSCPFVRPTGCLVYPDRPDTCRTFPLELGLLYNADQGKNEMVCFYRPPSFCLGPNEPSRWTFRSWEKDQGAQIYHRMTVIWSEIKKLFVENPWGANSNSMDDPKAKMAFMAVYNIDKFREFVFNSSFLKRYKIKSNVLAKIKKNDVELMLFGFTWIKLFLFGIPTSEITHY
jgi:uncharacterized protein